MTSRPTDTTSEARRPRRGYRSIWPTRRDLKGCYVQVSGINEDLIEVCIPSDAPEDDGLGYMYCFPLKRHEARMLAKRINQCLDATVIR